jgi:Cu/Ag efflux pump CusA
MPATSWPGSIRLSSRPILMLGGIIVGTLLTLLFLPALYVAWFRIKEPELHPQADCSSQQ